MLRCAQNDKNMKTMNRKQKVQVSDTTMLNSITNACNKKSTYKIQADLIIKF